MKAEKMYGCFLVVALGIFLCTAVGAEDLPWKKMLPFENATIHYAISGIEQGEETLYIRNYGLERARYSDSTTKIMGMAVQEKSVEFITPDYVYSYDLQAREGVKRVNPEIYMTKAYEDLSAEDKKQVLKNSELMGGAFIDGLAGKVQKKAVEILGYECDKVDIMSGGATYVMHGTGIPLKIEVNMMGMKMVTTATSVDTGRIDPKYFAHPEGLQARVDPEADAMAEAKGKQMMNALKDPDAAEKRIRGLHGAASDDNMSEEDRQMVDQAGELLKGMKNLFGQ